VTIKRIFGVIVSSLVAAGSAGGALANTKEFTDASSALLYEHKVKRDDGGYSHVRVYGRLGSSKGWIALVPSLGRGVDDFTEDFGSTLTTELARKGYKVVLIQPRGIGQSTGNLTPSEISMQVLSDDLKFVFDALEIDQVSLVGHAFGNRLSRYFAATNPDRVDDLILLAAGGDFELSAEQRSCLLGSFNLTLPDEQRLKSITCAFFAEGHDPLVWKEGWFPELAMAQIAAAQSVESDDFKRAGGVPFLLVQPEQDFIAPPELAGRPLAQELPEQVTYVEIADAGHALLPEQPDAVAEVILDYLERSETP